MHYELKDKLLAILNDYEEDKLALQNIYDEADYLSETLYPDEYPAYEENDPRIVHVKVLCLLETLRWIFPKDVKFIKTCLEKSINNPVQAMQEWKVYWDQKNMDETQRHKEGAKKGYWKQ